MTLFVYTCTVVDNSSFYCNFEDIDCPLINEDPANKTESWVTVTAENAELPADNTVNLGAYGNLKGRLL